MSANIWIHSITGATVKRHPNGRAVMIHLAHKDNSDHRCDPVDLHFEDTAAAERFLAEAVRGVAALPPVADVAECEGTDLPDASEAVGP